ncbi:hypothetical protein [Flavobacterium crassostreae]|nr:hypothetical protein [Flavobacterium crassostreae]
MKVLPNNSYSFKITGNETETLERLKRRTEISEKLISKKTDKSFIGIVKENTFRIISSEIGKGAFCVLTGEINNQKGEVGIEINKAFRILLSVFLCLPFVGLIMQLFLGKSEFLALFILVFIGQLLVIRYLFIEFVFQRLSRSSLNKLNDILDIEYIEKD